MCHEFMSALSSRCVLLVPPTLLLLTTRLLAPSATWRSETQPTDIFFTYTNRSLTVANNEGCVAIQRLSSRVGANGWDSFAFALTQLLTNLHVEVVVHRDPATKEKGFN